MGVGRAFHHLGAKASKARSAWVLGKCVGQTANLACFDLRGQTDEIG